MRMVVRSALLTRAGHPEHYPIMFTTPIKTLFIGWIATDVASLQALLVSGCRSIELAHTLRNTLCILPSCGYAAAAIVPLDCYLRKKLCRAFASSGHRHLVPRCSASKSCSKPACNCSVLWYIFLFKVVVAYVCELRSLVSEHEYALEA